MAPCTKTFVNLALERNPEINKRIINACKERERREIRQVALYKEYANGIKISEGNNFINVNGLAQKYTYSMTPQYVLSSLYLYVDMKNLRVKNMFSLPLEKTFAVTEFDEKNCSQIDELRKEYTKMFNQDILNSSLSHNPNPNFTDSLRKIIMQKEWRGTIINKANDYDHVKVEFLYKNSNGQIVSLFNERDNLIKNNESIFLHLVEQKNQTKILDTQILGEILEISKINSNSYIGKIDGVIIENKFDNSNIYDLTEYDKAYGPGSFHVALINSLDLVINLTGNESIRHEKTIDLIKNKALKVTKNNEALANKIMQDLIEGSEHSCSDTFIEIGKVMDSYGIAGYELLFTMFRNNAPFGMGIVDFLLNDQTMDDFTLNHAKIRVEEKPYIDYLNGVSIKNCFRKKHGEKQNIHIHSFDSRTASGRFYECILWLMQYKLTNGNKQLE
jgi:hypothetical protein